MQRSGVAEDGGFYNVMPGTTTWFYFVNQDRN